MNIKPRRYLPTLCAVLALLTSCSGSDSSASPRSTTSNRALDTGPISIVTPAAFVTAPSVASDTTVAITPHTYQDPSDPCFGLQQTTPLLQAPTACRAAWQELSVLSIPGEDITTASPIPHRAQISSSVGVTAGSAAALAFYRYEVLSTFVVVNNDIAAVVAVDGPGYQTFDRILAVMRGDGTTPGATVSDVPTCSQPTSIRVTNIDAGAVQYLTAGGWPAPSHLAIVANFATCPGFLFQYRGQNSLRVFGNNAPATTVTTGSIRHIAPYGDIWVTDGYAVCGVPQMKSVCGI